MDFFGGGCDDDGDDDDDDEDGETAKIMMRSISLPKTGRKQIAKLYIRSTKASNPVVSGSKNEAINFDWFFSNHSCSSFRTKHRIFFPLTDCGIRSSFEKTPKSRLPVLMLAFSNPKMLFNVT